MVIVKASERTTTVGPEGLWVGIQVYIAHVLDESSGRALNDDDIGTSFSEPRKGSDKPWSIVSARSEVIPRRVWPSDDTTWLELEPSCRFIIGIRLIASPAERVLGSVCNVGALRSLRAETIDVSIAYPGLRCLFIFPSGQHQENGIFS